MEIRIKSIHFDATEKLQEFINKKVEKLQKSYEDIQKVEVQLKVEKPAAALNKTTSLTVTHQAIHFSWRKRATRLRKVWICVWTQ